MASLSLGHPAFDKAGVNVLEERWVAHELAKQLFGSFCGAKARLVF